MTATIETQQLGKEFVRGQFRIEALRNIDMTIEKGEFVALMGPSGSGKSTLLHVIAAMDRATSGQVHVLGQDLGQLSERELAAWRNQHVGFVFQNFNLIPVLTALENVEIPLRLTNLSKAERRQHAATALKLVGLEDRMHHYPKQLSGGQEQRVSIARAIVTDPDLILADEPTGNLDAASAKEALRLLEKLNRDFGKTIVMVTHDPQAARHALKVRHLEKGVLLPEGTLPDEWVDSSDRAEGSWRHSSRG
jgi:putative ABC transport system ATP-binding protein